MLWGHLPSCLAPTVFCTQQPGDRQAEPCAGFNSYLRARPRPNRARAEQPLCKAKASQLSPVEGGTITQGAPPQSELCIYPGESERLPPAAGFPTSGWQVKTPL